MVGISLQLRRIPLLVFRHAAMITDDEDRRLRGRAGNRPGDVLRMCIPLSVLCFGVGEMRAVKS